MLETIALTLMSSLSTDYRKNSYLANVVENNDNDIENFVDTSEQNYFKGFSNIDNVNKIKNQLFQLLSQTNISYSVYNNASNFLTDLPELVLEKIEIENIYCSKYGTVMVDLEVDDANLFSLEIGKDSAGFFSEVDSSTLNYCDEVATINKEGNVINSNVVIDAIEEFLNVQNIA